MKHRLGPIYSDPFKTLGLILLIWHVIFLIGNVLDRDWLWSVLSGVGIVIALWLVLHKPPKERKHRR